MPTSNHTKQILIGNFKTQSHVLCTAFFCSQVSKTTWNVLNCYVNLTIDSMLQRVCSVVDHSWRQSVVTKKWRSEPCGLNVTISVSCYWSVAIFTTSLESQESYLTLKNLTLQITRDFFRLHNTFARLYNAAASPASRLRSAGSLAISNEMGVIRFYGKRRARLNGILRQGALLFS